VTPEEVNAYWTRRFPECPPVGYLFKHLYRERCVRLRLLENGRRVPESGADFAEIRRRQHELFDGVFESEPKLVLITTIPSELETPPKGAPPYLNFDPQGAFLHSLGMHEFELEFDTPSFWHLFVSERVNRNGELDAVLRAAATDSSESGVVNTLVLGPATARVIYVYPGGADVVLESPGERASFRERFSAWAV
jgi:hypothetical protein